MRKKINLVQISQKEMNSTNAGAEIPAVCITPNCGCLCNGPSSTEANCSANHAGGLHSVC